MKRDRRIVRWAGVAAVPLCAASLPGQYALDSNLQAGGGRVNPASGYAMPLARDPYRINRNTGTFQYYEPGAFDWGPRRYTVGAQEYLMRTGLMDTYSRPIQTMGSYAYAYDRNGRSQAYRYNETNALSRQGYGVYQPSGPAPLVQNTIEIGESTPTYRRAKPSAGAYERSATIDATIPMTSQPGYDLDRTSIGGGSAHAPRSSGNIENLTPQVYRPPFVRIASDAE